MGKCTHCSSKFSSYHPQPTAHNPLKLQTWCIQHPLLASEGTHTCHTNKKQSNCLSKKKKITYRDKDSVSSQILNNTISWDWGDSLAVKSIYCSSGLMKFYTHSLESSNFHLQYHFSTSSKLFHHFPEQPFLRCTFWCSRICLLSGLPWGKKSS